MTQQGDATFSSALQALPSEIIASVCSLLCNSDIKSLRLTCRFLRANAFLRLERVFISANPRNIEVFLAIANNDVFRHRVREIIWDDAVLKDVSNKDNDGPSGYSSGESDPDDDAANGDEEIMSRDLTYLCKDAIDTSEGRLKGLDKNYHSDDKHHRQLDNLMRSRDSLAYWNVLLKQQRKVLRSGADETAFRYAVQRFPRLNKVTVTPATHGFLFTPLYQTPMIRSFPSGFVYPLPRGWPSNENSELDDSDGLPDGWENEEERKQWRGVCIVSKVLADFAETLQVSELALDSHKLPTGIDYTFFKRPNADYDNLCKIVEQPGFKSITLSLITAYISDCNPDDFEFYRNGRISGLLARAPDLESFVYQTDYSHNPGDADEEDIFVSLSNIFPIDLWTTGRLKHFGLRGILVTQDDLVSFLSNLPLTLQSVELSFLAMVEGNDYAGLLTDIRDKLDWRHRPKSQRIQVTISVTSPNVPHDGRYINLDREVQEYIYGDGPSPFPVVEGMDGDYVPFGTGIVLDEFDTSFRRTYNGYG
ncbi:uncharacterized protein B0J16DRAFT_400318 [Fusarium flagelliforme]|uniref:uncharacterized protein n=1 Tax=Fusarium flagelliforme TaxID=2675880 RepID=UPI001E8D7F9D|nr:uncharacterized protein B0J16DRAFT_400318 [Fusarium flagelliforme]KAH7186251.1 hypothetical protein B0J16DRAFT_400318 [Fusarium flagelliforme]